MITAFPTFLFILSVSFNYGQLVQKIPELNLYAVWFKIDCWGLSRKSCGHYSGNPFQSGSSCLLTLQFLRYVFKKYKDLILKDSFANTYWLIKVWNIQKQSVNHIIFGRHPELSEKYAINFINLYLCFNHISFKGVLAWEHGGIAIPFQFCWGVTGFAFTSQFLFSASGHKGFSRGDFRPAWRIWKK